MMARRPIDPGAGSGGGPGPITGGALIEIKFVMGEGEDEVEISTRSVTDDVAAILAENGFDPDSFEVLSWPTGATRHSRIRLLMSKGDFDELKDALPEWHNPIGVEIVGLLFQRMYVLDHAVVAYSEVSGPVYAVDVVDARYH